MRINNEKNSYNNLNFKNLSALGKPLGAFYNANAVMPTFIIECGVTAGRTFEANKKGGKIEASERLVEQGTSAVIWIWGVQFLKKIGETIGSKFLKNNDLNFDIGFDYLRNPLENLSKEAVKFKAANLFLSTALATAFIGFGLPKINHLITKKMLKQESKEKEENSKKAAFIAPNFENFRQKTSKAIPFTSLYENGLIAANILQNNSAARLLATDTGVVAGRFYNARNKFEKIECLFRDISSIYFYLFSTKHLVKLFNKLASNTDIDPAALEVTVEMLKKNLKKSTVTDKHNFSNKAIGNAKLGDLRKIDEMFKDKKIVALDDFTGAFKDFANKAEIMAQLQPKLKEQRVLNKTQAYDIVNSGWVSNPKFLNSVYDAVTKGAYKDKNRFISAKHVEKIRKSVDEFILQIQRAIDKKGGIIDSEFIEKVAKNNIKKNFAFYSIGTLVSMFALGILIPKIQYMIRRKLTNNDEFVGVKEYK